MANYSSPFQQKLFVQAQTGGLNTVNNNGGTWNSAGAQYIRIEENGFALNPNEPKQSPNLKHGSPDQLASIFQRKSGNGTLSVPIIPSGTQAVAPDTDLLFRAIFGGAGALATGTNFGNAWQYSFTNFQTTLLSMFSFLHGQAATANRYGVGCVISRATITFNGNILTMALTFVCASVGTVETFTVMDTVAKGGLTSFPTEPGTTTSNGNVINGFGGTLYWGGVAVSGQCNSLTIDIETGYSLNDGFVDSAYPMAVMFGSRKVTAALGFVNNDSTILQTMKQNARTNTGAALGFYLGTTPGQRFYALMNGVQLVPETLRDNSNYVEASFAQSSASVAPGGSNSLVCGFA